MAYMSSLVCNIAAIPIAVAVFSTELLDQLPTNSMLVGDVYDKDT